MARSVFYYHLSHMDEGDGYANLRDRIKAIYNENHGRYGYRRICYSLRNEGKIVNHKTVQKLMGQLGLKAKCKKRHYHSYKGEVGQMLLRYVSTTRGYIFRLYWICSMERLSLTVYLIVRTWRWSLLCLERHLSSITIQMVWYYTLIRDGIIST